MPHHFPGIPRVRTARAPQPLPFPAFSHTPRTLGPVNTGRPRLGRKEEAFRRPWCQVCKLGNEQFDEHGGGGGGVLAERARIRARCWRAGPCEWGEDWWWHHHFADHSSHQHGVTNPCWRAQARARPQSRTLVACSLQASVHIVFWRATGFSRIAGSGSCLLMCVPILI